LTPPRTAPACCGCTRLDALFDAARTLARARARKGPRWSLLTNGGGAGVLAADALALGGGTPRRRWRRTRWPRSMRCCRPPGPRPIPVDIIGDAPVERYADAMRVLLAAPGVDGVLFMHAPTAIVPADAIAQACLPLLARRGQAGADLLAGRPVVLRGPRGLRGRPAWPATTRPNTRWMAGCS
jgi:acyl-CoA synthetase (NDP forming)